jgi:hypothetical protein
MNWLTCTVEMRTHRTDELITGEFEGRSLFEAAWFALCEWCQQWYYDPDAVLTVRKGEGEWRVTQARIRAWRPLVRAEEARRQIAAARIKQEPLFDRSPDPL